MSFPESANLVIAFGTLLAGGAAIWGAITAHRGLASWKSQQLWLRDSELVKQMLVAIYERQDAIRHIRSPLRYSSKEAFTDKRINYKEVKEDYERRLTPLREAQKSFYAHSNEAKAVWGNAIEDLAAKLRSFEVDLLIAVEDHVARQNPDSTSFDQLQADEKLVERRMLYGSGGVKDEFAQNYSDAVIELEEFLRRKLLP